MKQPNIVFILIDDMGWKDLSCTGSTFYETPHIDSLRHSGKKFTMGYAACPVCSPTRASIMTGKYPAGTGVTDWINHNRPADSPEGNNRGRLISAPYTDHLSLEEYSLAKALRDGGYQTWHVGKWHLGKDPWYPENHGFDVNIGGCYIGSPGAGGYFSPWTGIPALEDADVSDGTYLTDYLTDETLGLLKERDKSKPFFLNLWYYSVHTPIQAKPEKIEKYEKKAIQLGLDQEKVFKEGDFFPCDYKKEEHIQRRLVQSDPVYAAMIESLDENIGRVLDELRDQNLLDDTIIIFTSDNGGLSTAESSPTSNLPLSEGKGWLFEGGVREPLLISWPGTIEPGSVCDVPVISTDFYPTLLEAANLPLIPEQHKDGVSILPLLNGGNIENRPLFWHYPHYGNQGGTPGSSMLLYPWKLIEFFEDDRLELYNIEEDQEEKRDRSTDQVSRTLSMIEQLHNWQQMIGARLPQLNKDFVPWSKDHEVRGFQPWD